MVDKKILAGLRDLKKMVANMEKPNSEFTKAYRVGLKDGINAAVKITEEIIKAAGKRID